MGRSGSAVSLNVHSCVHIGPLVRAHRNPDVESRRATADKAPEKVRAGLWNWPCGTFCPAKVAPVRRFQLFSIALSASLVRAFPKASASRYPPCKQSARFSWTTAGLQFASVSGQHGWEVLAYACIPTVSGLRGCSKPEAVNQCYTVGKSRGSITGPRHSDGL